MHTSRFSIPELSILQVGFDAEDIDRDLIAERLGEDNAASKGRMYRKLAGELSFDMSASTFFKCNSESFTSIATVRVLRFRFFK